MIGLLVSMMHYRINISCFKLDYGVLQGQYNSLVVENAKFVNEWKEVNVAIEKCYDVINSYDVAPSEEPTTPFGTKFHTYFLYLSFFCSSHHVFLFYLLFFGRGAPF